MIHQNLLSTCPPTMIVKDCQFCSMTSTDVHLSIKVKLINMCKSYATSTGKSEAHDSVQRPWVSKCGLKSFLYIFWDFSGVLHEILLERSPTEFFNVYYHLLTKVAGNYRSHNKTATIRVSFLLQDYDLKDTKNETLSCLFNLNSLYSPKLFAFISFSTALSDCEMFKCHRGG